MEGPRDSLDVPKTLGHRRLPSVGKAMPVTSLLLNFSPAAVGGSTRASHMRGGEQEHEQEQEVPPIYFTVEPPNTPDAASTSTSSIEIGIVGDNGRYVGEYDDDDDTSSEASMEQAYELLVSECSSADDGSRRGDGNDDVDALVGNSTGYTPCLTCTGSAPPELAGRCSALSEMCRRLCTDECRLRLSLAGFQPPSAAALHSREALADAVRQAIGQRPSAEDMPASTPPSCIAMQRARFLSEMLNAGQQQEPQEPLSQQSHDAEADRRALRQIVAHEFDMLKDFREKFAIAEALAKTSEMTSTTRIKQRLAARKLEIELELESATNAKHNSNYNHSNSSNNYNNNNHITIATNATADDGDHDNHGDDTPPQRAGADAEGEADNNYKNNNNALTLSDVVTSRATVAAASKQSQGGDFEPPRDLLLYLVRMGSFNSAPKINNVDSQDDGLEIPQGLNTGELLQHVKRLRGENQPPLLSRYFLKTTLTTAQMMLPSHDVADGLRCLKLNSMSRACSAPTMSPNHIRLLQWNILSQTLGQNNDGFVCCPEQALTWENRKFLIVQEILQHNPDIICLQEVDHFKFLQNILGTQNYEGIFYPKPDSPCLYIEENNGPDGCAIFYKRDKFELKGYDKRVLEVWRVQSNQVAIAANLLVRDSGRELCVCTTHLKARHGSLLSKLRNEQGRDLIRFVKHIAGNRPVLMCGDFNAEPTEPVYGTMLSCDFLKMSSAYAQIKATTVDKECTNSNGENVTDECDKVQNSMKNEPEYTTWKIREEGEECHTIDYVFYSEDDFKVKNCLEFPQAEEIGKNRTPSFQYPSDHFSLVCDFEILDNKSQNDKTQ